MDETRRMQALVQPLPVAEPEEEMRPGKNRRARKSPAKEAYANPGIDDGRETELVRLLYESVATLSPAAVTTLLEYPETLLPALEAAARTPLSEPLAEDSEVIGGQPARLLGRTEAARRLSQRTRTAKDEAGELLTSQQFAKRVGAKSRQSVHNWLRQGRILGWEGTKRGLVFPAGQLDESGRPLNGLGVVVRHFEGHYSAWCWLRDRHDDLDGARPIDLLRHDDVARVESAAKGYAQGDFG